ncbi:LysM peptidoglycan-binding domain-containing protein [Haloferula rosea]|uniref:LysM peptidoglycan-binding domain-containing protein n=1 Tax=Haloferula rosea TaxID=490093 RepID=A0A934RDU6_9BACT|nr:LysM peptidoglycan-binding domain-containing protein [Haloferula rosea]MBK1827409.1 LysM peptidoglycan-binding domain-containing protein [Haloferula rosea]
MKAMFCLSFSAMMLTATPAWSSDRLADLERRCAEQERQIERLELENSRLRSAGVSTTTQAKTTPVSAPKATAESSTSSVPAPKAQPVHIVKAGETLSGIAKKHGLKTSELVKCNQLKNAEVIQIGQRLKLPLAASQPDAAPVKPTTDDLVVRGTHKVKQGETFYSIAKTYGLSVKALGSANPSVNPRALRVGQELQLVARRAESSSTSSSPAPVESAEEAPQDLGGSQTILNKRPTVRRVPITEQITLQQFADQYDMDIARLKRLNGLSDERYHSKTVLAEGSALFVSAQPLD